MSLISDLVLSKNIRPSSRAAVKRVDALRCEPPPDLFGLHVPMTAIAKGGTSRPLRFYSCTVFLMNKPSAVAPFPTRCWQYLPSRYRETRKSLYSDSSMAQFSSSSMRILLPCRVTAAVSPDRASSGKQAVLYDGAPVSPIMRYLTLPSS